MGPETSSDGRLSFAKLDFVLHRRRTQGAGAAMRVVKRFAFEWLGRQLFRLQYPAVEWGRDVQIKGKLVIRGQGRVIVGDGCVFDAASGAPNSIALFSPDAIVRLGEGTYLNGVSILAAESVSVGPECVLGQCVISDGDFHPVDADARVAGAPGKVRPVTIGPRAWLGTSVLVMKGVTIGAEAVVGAGTVVRRSVPDRAVVTGGDAQVRFEIARNQD